MMELGYQFLIGEVVGRKDTPQSVSEDVLVVSVVEPPLQFFKVAVQMLGADLVERAHNGPLEQAPDALDAVGVNVSDDPVLCQNSALLK